MGSIVCERVGGSGIAGCLEARVGDHRLARAPKAPVGAVLHALIGYDDQPSAMQLIFFAVTFIVIASLMRWVGRRSAPATARHHDSREAAPQRS